MSVRAFAEQVFALLGLNAQKHIKVDPRYLRPAEVDHLCGDASKARRVLGWEPRTTTDKLIAMMVEGDLKIAQRERTLRDAGHEPEPPAAQGR
jgi:GDPmannose 4,6-dehydratase